MSLALKLPRVITQLGKALLCCFSRAELTLPRTYLPLAAWQSEPVEIGNTSPPVHAAELSSFNETPAELPSNLSYVHEATPDPVQHARAPSDSYYEDVDPRFAADDPVSPVLMDSHARQAGSPLPAALMPGYAPNAYQRNLGSGNSSLYDPEPTARVDSPTHSEASHFTSISQRQINPNWRPAPGQMGPAYQPRGAASSVYSGVRAPARWREHDTLLAANPDFALAGPAVGRGRGLPMGISRGRGGGHSSGMSGGAHRYPDAI